MNGASRLARITILLVVIIAIAAIAALVALVTNKIARDHGPASIVPVSEIMESGGNIWLVLDRFERSVGVPGSEYDQLGLEELPVPMSHIEDAAVSGSD